MAVATEAFAEMGQDTARSLGLSGLPLLAVEQSFEGGDEHAMESLAEKIYPEIVRALTADARELEPAYASLIWLSPEEAINAVCSIEGHVHS